MPLILLLLGSLFAGAAQSSSRDVDIAAPDGTKLKATYVAAATPAPAVMLLHMCNTTRVSWEQVAQQLSAKGINALTLDNANFAGGPIVVSALKGGLNTNAIGGNHDERRFGQFALKVTF